MPGHMHAQEHWLGTPVTFSGKGALKVSITLAESCLLAVTFAHGFLMKQFHFIR
jgi:hypothetical protein